MISPDISYGINVLLSAGAVSAYIGGLRKGKNQAATEANEAQSLTISAQTERIHILETQRDEDRTELIELRAQVSLLKEMVLHGNSAVVQAGTVSIVPGGGRSNTSGDPSNSNNRGV